MPFCPKCRYEYKSGVSTCPDCDEALVSALPTSDPGPESVTIPQEYKDWVQLARLASYQSAQMVMEAWNAKDIPGVVLSGAGHFGQTGQMGPSSFKPVGGEYSMMVPPEHVVNADVEASGILGDEWEDSKLVDLE